MDTSNPPQAVVHNSTIIDWAFDEERQNGGRAELRNGGTAEQHSSRSNGYLSTSFMVHADDDDDDDDVTLMIYNIERSLTPDTAEVTGKSWREIIVHPWR
jgi:hypothetical protein